MPRPNLHPFGELQQLLRRMEQAARTSAGKITLRGADVCVEY